MSKHTPEPWRHTEPKIDPQYHKLGPRCDIFGEGFVAKTVPPKDAARIVSCVNALAGVADPAEYMRRVGEAVKAADGVARQWGKLIKTRGLGWPLHAICSGPANGPRANFTPLIEDKLYTALSALAAVNETKD